MPSTIALHALFHSSLYLSFSYVRFKFQCFFFIAFVLPFSRHRWPFAIFVEYLNSLLWCREIISPAFIKRTMIRRASPAFVASPLLYSTQYVFFFAKIIWLNNGIPMIKVYNKQRNWRVSFSQYKNQQIKICRSFKHGSVHSSISEYHLKIIQGRK